MRQVEIPASFVYMKKSLKSYCFQGFWRRCRDLNPSAGKTDLPDFESGPFNHLGTSPDMFELRFGGEKTEQIIKFC